MRVVWSELARVQTPLENIDLASLLAFACRAPTQHLLPFAFLLLSPPTPSNMLEAKLDQAALLKKLLDGLFCQHSSLLTVQKSTSF